MKRFYKLVSIAARPDGFAILLDGKPVKTPSGKKLLAHQKNIADIIMLEWSEQVEEICPGAMPVSQWLITCQDIVPNNRKAIEKELLDYIDTDLICYRADHEPYLSRQHERWNRTIEWLEKKSATRIKTVSALTPLKQDPGLHFFLQNYLSALDDFKLTVLQSIVDDSGSLMLAAAFLERVLNADELWHAVFVDDMIRAEIYHEDKYGAAPDQDKKRDALKRNFEAAEKILANA